MYSGVDDVAAWVLPRVLEEQAATRADAVFVSMVDGDELTYGALRDQAAQVAGLLSGWGVRAGDRVAVMLPAGIDFLRAWAGVQRLGAVAVLLNPELMGSFLAHPLKDSGAIALIIDDGFVSRLDGLRHDLPTLARVTGSEAFEAWRTAPAWAGPMPAASDLACIMYTSGTTGPPKGVLMPHAHCFLFGLGVVENLTVTAEDRYYVCLPLFHANGLLMQLGAVLIAGAHATVRERFSASAWLEDVRASQATLTHSLGAISAFVTAQPVGAHDKDHRLRLLFTAPNHPVHDRLWRERFGIAEVLGGYGMTETNIPLYGDRADPRPGTCGRVWARCFEVEIRDPDTDFPLPSDTVGEIMVRPRIAQGFMAGYNGLPDKTVEAWRNLWFHTGDAGRMATDGYVTFVDRIKDCIRRRGENVSALDIEQSLAVLPGVIEIAAYAVPSDVEGGEDEIMLAIVQAPGVDIAPSDVIACARERMPRFAQPRYLRFVDALPKTETEKIRKVDLRKAGVTADTIDLDRI
jgi:crotonobetaine/carnitine-CoA ligase